jgi:hypothetical protein
VPRSFILKLQSQQSEISREENGANNRMQTKTASSLLVLMGSLDWLTTIVGIVYFGAVEGNPFMAGLANTNLPAFTAIKLGTAFFVGFLFYLADKTLNQTENKSGKGFVLTRHVLKGAYLASVIFLLFAVMNNVLSVANAAK